MKTRTQASIDELFARYPQLEPQRDNILKALDLLIECYRKKGKVMICGNGGSASDSEHIVGELMKCFYRKRQLDPIFRQRLVELYGAEEAISMEKCLEAGVPAISLVSQTGLITAFANDVAPDYIFAQQVYGYCNEGDIVWGLSTSGNSKNVVNAVKVAKARGGITIGMTGAKGGLLKEMCDVCICAPETETFKVQELHLPIYHLLCIGIESELFD